MAYNLALSQRRAETVKQELIRQGIAENRIVFASGWGELYPNCLELTGMLEAKPTCGLHALERVEICQFLAPPRPLDGMRVEIS